MRKCERERLRRFKRREEGKKAKKERERDIYELKEEKIKNKNTAERKTKQTLPPPAPDCAASRPKEVLFVELLPLDRLPTKTETSCSSIAKKTVSKA